MKSVVAQVALLLTVVLTLYACGGGSTSTPPATNQAQPDFTAVVNVNVSTGLVTFTPSTAVSKTSRTVFTGPTVSMSSTTLVTQAGTPGVKSTSVTLTNNSSSPLGIDPNNNVTGVRVLFGAFTVTGGSSADPIELSNPTGIVPNSGAGTNLPYISYPGQIAPNKTAPAQNWNFIVPSGVTAFSVPVTIEADNSYLAPPGGTVNQGSSTVYVRTSAGSLVDGYLNGPAAEAEFNGANSVAVDSAGDLYVADLGNNVIRRISPAGTVSTVAGSAVVGGSFANGTGNLAEFNEPAGIAVTPDGSTLYVTDIYNEEIRRIAYTGGDPTNPANWYVTTIAGTGGSGGNYSSPTPGSSATFNRPYGIALDPGGNIYFTEELGNRVRRMIFTGGDPSQAANWEVYLVAGDSSAAAGASGDGDSTNGSFARFNIPTGVASDASGKVYVADYGNSRIRMITPAGVVTTFAGGTSGSAVSTGYLDGAAASAKFYLPIGVGVDSSGLVYVADTYNHRIRQISQAGNVTTLAGTGAAAIVDGTGYIAQFLQPTGVAITSSGTAYVADYAAIRLLERINSQ